jgi:hypothetical protein
MAGVVVLESWQKSFVLAPAWPENLPSRIEQVRNMCGHISGGVVNFSHKVTKHMVIVQVGD